MKKYLYICFALAGIFLQSLISAAIEKQIGLKPNAIISRVELEVYPSIRASKEFLPLAESYASYNKAFKDLQKTKTKPSDDFKQLVTSLLSTVKAKINKIDEPRIVLKYDVDEYQKLSDEIEKLLKEIEEAQK